MYIRYMANYYFIKYNYIAGKESAPNLNTTSHKHYNQQLACRCQHIHQLLTNIWAFHFTVEILRRHFDMSVVSLFTLCHLNTKIRYN